MGIQSEFGELILDIENVVQNNYHQEFDIPDKGKSLESKNY